MKNTFCTTLEWTNAYLAYKWADRSTRPIAIVMFLALPITMLAMFSALKYKDILK